MIAESLHKVILAVLKARFGALPRNVGRLLRGIISERKLKRLIRLAAKCPDLEAFREALQSKLAR
jgi:hypothetical protein